MFMKFIEIYRKDQSRREYSLRDVFLNTDFIVSAIPEESIKELTQECATLKMLSDKAEYTRLFISRGNMGHEVVVIESFDNLVGKILNAQSKSSTNIIKG